MDARLQRLQGQAIYRFGRLVNMNEDPAKVNIRKIDEGWKEESNARGGRWKFRDLSGENLGVRIEELGPGSTSSEHHYHTAEEEHVIMLDGCATLVLGDEKHPLSAGDHVWFRAGEELAHHIINESSEPCQFLVFGERKAEDVVVYPEHQVMMLKSLGFKQFTYRNLTKD